MLPIDKLLFRKRKLRDHTVLAGELVLGELYYISDYEQRFTKFDMTEYAKIEMRRKIWHRTYGELTSPLRELQKIADFETRHSPYNQRIRELCEELNKLLAYPSK